MGKIYESRNYSMFEMHPFNRELRKTTDLEMSMRKYGWKDAWPAYAVTNGANKLLIKDGHHRFVVAVKLGIPIKYVIDKDDITIEEINICDLTWKLKDYLNAYVKLGYEPYIKAQSFSKQTGIPIYSTVSMMAGNSSGTGNMAPVFRAGEFKITSDHYLVVGGIVLVMKANKIKYANSAQMVQAISKAVWVKEINIERLKTKIRKHPHILDKRGLADQCLEMLEEVYNFASRDKLPIKFLANEEAKRRQMASLK